MDLNTVIQYLTIRSNELESARKDNMERIKGNTDENGRLADRELHRELMEKDRNLISMSLEVLKALRVADGSLEPKEALQRY